MLLNINIIIYVYNFISYWKNITSVEAPSKLMCLLVFKNVLKMNSTIIYVEYICFLIDTKSERLDALLRN